MKPLIKYEDFSKLDLRVGEIIECVRKEESDKLLRLTVDFGDEGKRNILSGLYPYYDPEDLKGKQFIFIVNLEPRKFMGEESQGMILCADGDKPITIKPELKTKPGSKIS
jgi:methionine--tRNA ligase beta chain